MNKEFKFKMPIYMILLDIFGATLAALGLLEWFTDMSFVPDQLKLEYYYIAMVIIGVLLMVPMHLHIYRFVTRKKTSDTC